VEQPGDATYEVYALRYGGTRVQKAEKYHRFGEYGERDRAAGLDFYFWLLRNSRRTVLLDCGFDAQRGAARGYHQDHHPLDLLRRLGVEAADVDHVVLSHMHFDHIGNVALFPNATFSVARTEFDYWTGPFADRRFLAESGDALETGMVADLLREGRVRLIEGSEAVFPGVQVTPVRGHTPGQLITGVATDTGHVVLASDAVHLYEELERDRPYWVFHDLEGMYHGYELLRTLAARPRTSIVAGHDPAVMTRFRSLDETCVDLSVALDQADAAGAPGA
jgi:glyoxylase-like metal-dependent hydrolase (beta-lactamase superfamily II)